MKVGDRVVYLKGGDRGVIVHLPGLGFKCYFVQEDDRGQPQPWFRDNFTLESIYDSELYQLLHKKDVDTESQE